MVFFSGLPLFNFSKQLNRILEEIPLKRAFEFLWPKQTWSVECLMSRAKRDVHSFKNISQLMRPPQSCDNNLLNCEFLVLNEIIFVVGGNFCGNAAAVDSHLVAFVVYEFPCRVWFLFPANLHSFRLKQTCQHTSHCRLQYQTINNQLTYTGPLLSVFSDHSCSFSWPWQRC